jgi:hypothetical protein
VVVFVTGPAGGETTVVVVAGGLFDVTDMQAPKENATPARSAISKIRTRFMREVRAQELTRILFFSGRFRTMALRGANCV